MLKEDNISLPFLLNKKSNTFLKYIIFVQVTTFKMLKDVYQKIKLQNLAGENAVSFSLKIKLALAKNCERRT